MAFRRRGRMRGRRSFGGRRRIVRRRGQAGRRRSSPMRIGFRY